MDKQTSTSLSEKSYVSPIKHLLNLEGVTSLIYDLLSNGKIIRDFDFTNSLMKKIHKAFDRIDNRSRISIAEENKDDIHTS